MNEFKPCPFCGGGGVITEYVEGSRAQKWYAVKCERQCGPMMGTCDKGLICGQGWPDEASAIAEWNTRPAEDTLAAEVAALKGKLKGMHRRAQKAEAANALTVEDCERKGVPLGRVLANAGYYKMEEELAALKEQNARLHRENWRMLGKHICAYCEQVFEPITAEKMREHIAACPKHPLREAEATISTLRAQVALLGEALNIMMDTFRCSPRNVDHEREADAYAKATAALAAPEVVAVREIRWCPTCNDIPHGLMVGTEECSICGDTVLKHSTVILKREGAAERNDTNGEGE